jgi:putative restriction endonuclease
MRPEFLGAYLENITVFHSSTEAALRRVVSQFPGEKSILPIEQKIRGVRKKIVFKRKQYPRDPNFVRVVKEAYSHSCAFCGVQLELVEAAHIVPHGKPDSSDDVSNGILLCATHHKAFDQGLIRIGADFRISVDRKRREYLVHLGRANGIRTLDGLAGRRMKLPINRRHWPTSRNLERRRRYYRV